MGISMTGPKEPSGVLGAYPIHTTPSPTALQTTLYELIAALSTEVGPEEDGALTATVVHLLQTHRVIYTSDRTQYRLVWDGGRTRGMGGRASNDRIRVEEPRLA